MPLVSSPPNGTGCAGASTGSWRPRERNFPMDDADRMIRDSLRRLRVPCRSLPRTSRDELIAEVTAHIEEARAAGEAADEVGVRNLLARLGEPDDAAAAAVPAASDV